MVPGGREQHVAHSAALVTPSDTTLPVSLDDRDPVGVFDLETRPSVLNQLGKPL